MAVYSGAKGRRAHETAKADSLNAGTIRDLIDLAFVLVKGKHKSHKKNDDSNNKDGYDCAVSKHQIRW